jgi:hypothetical protein
MSTLEKLTQRRTLGDSYDYINTSPTPFIDPPFVGAISVPDVDDAC